MPVGLVARHPAGWIRRGTTADTATYRLYAISDELTITPEPGSLALIGLGGLLMLRRRG